MNNLKELKIEDLQGKILELKEKLRSFRFALSGSKVKNVKEGRENRKEIARLLTELSFREKNI